VIVLAVRWYLRFGLSYRDVEELLAERGIQVDRRRCCVWSACGMLWRCNGLASDALRQIAEVISSNAPATRRFTGASTASS
jgi:hypothetical protein